MAQIPRKAKLLWHVIPAPGVKHKKIIDRILTSHYISDKHTGKTKVNIMSDKISLKMAASAFATLGALVLVFYEVAQNEYHSAVAYKAQIEKKNRTLDFKTGNEKGPFSAAIAFSFNNMGIGNLYEKEEGRYAQKVDTLKQCHHVAYDETRRALNDSMKEHAATVQCIGSDLQPAAVYSVAIDKSHSSFAGRLIASQRLQ